jgi:hypothetical protein
MVIFPPEHDFETRVNNFLGSKIPADLSLEPQAPSISSPLSPNKGEFGGLKMSPMGKSKQSLSGALEGLKGKQPCKWAGTGILVWCMCTKDKVTQPDSVLRPRRLESHDDPQHVAFDSLTVLEDLE